MNKTVSIIIPCFNDRASLGAALASIDKQNYAHIEIIVIDDYSTIPLDINDISKLTKHPITLIRNNKNLGANLSINEGFNAAVGDYICILAADDVLPEGSVFHRVELLNNGADLVLGATKQILNGTTKIIKSIDLHTNAVLGWLANKEELRGINNATAMYTNTLRKKTGYRLQRGEKGSHEDYEYVLRLFTNARNPVATDHICYIYKMDESSTMFTEIKKHKSHWNIALANLEDEYKNKILLMK